MYNPVVLEIVTKSTEGLKHKEKRRFSASLFIFKGLHKFFVSRKSELRGVKNKAIFFVSELVK